MDLRYRNDLPRPNVDPKYIKIPWNAEKLYNYHISSLEQHYKYRVHIEPGVGAPINLIDPRTAELEGVRLSDADRHLIRRENDEVQDFYRGPAAAGGAGGKAPLALSSFGNMMSARNIHEGSTIRKGKHWLRKTEYIDNMQTGSIHNYLSGQAENEKKLAEIEKLRRLQAGNAERLSKAERIERSFELASKVPEHASKKGLRPVKIFSVVPRLDLCDSPYFHVQFLDENVMEDKTAGAEAEQDKGAAEALPSKRKRKASVEYSAEQVGALQSALLEQLLEEEADRISLFVPTTEPGELVSDQEGDEGEGPAAQLDDSADAPSSSSTGSMVKWVRDYRYGTHAFNPSERFAFVWDREALEAPADPTNVLYSKVGFVQLEEHRLEMTRKQTDQFDIAASRRKRIMLKRRDTTADELQAAKDRVREYEEGDLLEMMDESDEQAFEDASGLGAAPPVGKDKSRSGGARASSAAAAKAKSKVEDEVSSSGAESDSSSGSDDDGDDGEEELDLGAGKAKAAAKPKPAPVKDDVSDSESDSE